MTQVSPFTPLIAKAALAPSVHNVQPARWRIDGDSMILIEDTARRLAVGDPTGNDAAISLGAAAEGLRLAASEAGCALQREDAPPLTSPWRGVARYRLVPGASADPLAALVEQRQSWRAGFERRADDRARAAALAGADRVIVHDAAKIADLAALYDRASYGFMRKTAFRAELRSWMRLSRRDPNWARDGLNAEAMALSRIEVWGAGLALGPLFAALDTVRIAPLALADAPQFRQAAAVVLFFRPEGEDPFVSGAAFYRLWLEIEAAGFGAAVLAALADDRSAAAALAQRHDPAGGRRLVSAFRIGNRPAGPRPARARLPLAELLV